MTALTPAEAAKALRHLADRIEADPAIPPLSSCWPLVFHVTDCQTSFSLAAIGRSLGAEDTEIGFGEEEDGTFWLRLRGHVGGVAVEVTADVSEQASDAPGCAA
jgi:hypothetical protein